MGGGEEEEEEEEEGNKAAERKWEIEIFFENGFSLPFHVDDGRKHFSLTSSSSPSSSTR